MAPDSEEKEGVMNAYDNFLKSVLMVVLVFCEDVVMFVCWCFVKILFLFYLQIPGFYWNYDLGDLPVVPILHGTDHDTATKICNTGFTTLASVYVGHRLLVVVLVVSSGCKCIGVCCYCDVCIGVVSVVGSWGVGVRCCIGIGCCVVCLFVLVVGRWVL